MIRSSHTGLSPSQSNINNITPSSNFSVNSNSNMTAMTNSTTTPRYHSPPRAVPTLEPASTPPNMSATSRSLDPLSVTTVTPSMSQHNSHRVTTANWSTSSSEQQSRITTPHGITTTPSISTTSNLSTATSPFAFAALPFTINHTPYAFAALPGSATIGSKPALMLVPIEQLPSPNASPSPKPTQEVTNRDNEDPLGANNWNGVDTKLMQQGLLDQYSFDQQQTEQQHTNASTNSTAQTQAATREAQTTSTTRGTPHPSRRPTKPPIPLFRSLLSEQHNQSEHVQTHVTRYQPPRIIAERGNPPTDPESNHTTQQEKLTTASNTNTTRLSSSSKRRKRRRKVTQQRRNNKTKENASMSDSDGSTQTEQGREPPLKKHKSNTNDRPTTEQSKGRKKRPRRKRHRKWPGDTLSSILASTPPPMPSGSSCSSLSTGWSDHPSAEETGRLLTGLCEVDDIYSSDERQGVLLRADSKTDEDEPEQSDEQDENAPPNIGQLDQFQFVHVHNDSATTSNKQHQPQATHTAKARNDQHDIHIVHQAKSAPQRPKAARAPRRNQARSCFGIIDPRSKHKAQPLSEQDTNHNHPPVIPAELRLPSLSQHDANTESDHGLTQQTQAEQEDTPCSTPSVSPASIAEPYLYQPPTIKTHHPFAAGLPAQISPSNPVKFTNFDEALRHSGKFGHHVLKWRQIYYVMGHLAEVLSDGKIKCIAFDYSGEPTQRSKSKICPYWPDCRSCQLKQTHIACVIGTCGIFHSRYSMEPSDKTWAAVQHRKGSNKVMLDLIKNNHEFLYNDIKRHLVWLLQHNPKYIDNVIVPICKNMDGRRKLSIRGTKSRDYKHLRGHFGVDVAKFNAQKQEKRLKDECVRWLQGIWSGPAVGLRKRIACGPKFGFLRSRCPKHKNDPDRCCRLKEDGRVTTPQWVLFWDSAEYCVLCRYYCETHGAVKVAATHPQVGYHYTETLTRPCFRYGNTHVSTSGAAALRKTYKDTQMTYKALRAQMLTNYEQKLDRDIITNKVQCPDLFVPSIRRKALDTIIPNTQSLTQILQSVQLEVYPQGNERLDRLMFSTTPRHFGIDQTFDELSKVTLEDGTTLNIGCGSIACDHGYWCKWFMVNDNVENYEQTSKYAADIKAQVMYYGDLNVLIEHGITFSVDHLEKFQNLDVYIDHELEHNLKENPLYAQIAAKLDDAKVTVRDIETKKAECSMHLNRRKYKYARKDGVNTSNHRDFVLVSESETIWANSLQHADESMELYPHNDPLNIKGTRSDDYVEKHWGFLSATDVYWRYADQLQNTEAASKYKHAIKQILQLEGHTDLVSRYQAQQAMTADEQYQAALPLIHEIARGVHLDHVRQILGIFVTNSNGIDTEWIRNYKDFTDQRGRAYATMTHSTLHHIAMTFCKYFGRDVSDGEYIMIMQPRKDFVSLLYDTLKRTLRMKIYESFDHKTKPMMNYPNINKAIHLAATPLAITGFINNYNEDLSGVWVNVNNERIHCTAKFLEAASCRGQKKAARAILDIEVKRFHANTTIIDHLIRDIDEMFDDHFKNEYERIKDWVTSGYFKNVQERGICVHLTNKWTDHVTATRDLLNKRDIQRKHKKITHKLDRKLFHRDILLLRDSTNTITVSVLAYLYGRHGHSIQTLSKSLLRHGFDSDKFDDGSLVIDPQNIGRIYNMIEDKQFKEILIAPETNSNASQPPEDVMQLDLPEIPPCFQQQQESSTNSSSSNNARKKRSDKEERDETPEQDDESSAGPPSSARLLRYEEVGEPTDVDGVYRYQGRLVLHGAYQLDNYNAAVKAVEFVNQQIPHVSLNKNIIDDLSWREMSKREIIECFKDSSALARLFGPYIAAPYAKKIAKYMGNASNYARFCNWTGLSSLDNDPIEQYHDRHRTQLGVRPLGGNLLGNESLINPQRRRREAAAQKQDAIYLDKSKKPTTTPKWKQQTVFYDDYENYALPFVQWAEGCDCKRDEVHEAIKNGNHAYLSWPNAYLFEHHALDELSLFTLDAMGTKQRKQLAEWHGWDKSKHGNNVASAVDFLVIHHIMGEDMNEMTQEQVAKKLKEFFDWNKAIWMKQGKRFKKKAIKRAYHKKKK